MNKQIKKTNFKRLKRLSIKLLIFFDVLMLPILLYKVISKILYVNNIDILQLINKSFIFTTILFLIIDLVDLLIEDFNNFKK